MFHDAQPPQTLLSRSSDPATADALMQRFEKLDQESETSITLRTVTETVIIAKSEMKDHKKLAQSLMPPGLLEAMPERKALELLKFLTSKQ